MAEAATSTATSGTATEASLKRKESDMNGDEANSIDESGGWQRGSYLSSKELPLTPLIRLSPSKGKASNVLFVVLHGRQGRAYTSSNEFIAFDGTDALIHAAKEGNIDHMKSFGAVTTAVFDSIGDFFVTCCGKAVQLWDTSTWSLISTRATSKNISDATFARPGGSTSPAEVIVSERGGDVYRFLCEQPDVPGELIMGHLSIVMTVRTSPGGTRVLTADKNDKIRVSRYPLAHVIDAYCLGHRDTVNSIALSMKYPHLMISAASDGTVRLWRYLDGVELCVLHLPSTWKNSAGFPLVAFSLAWNDNLIAVTADCKSSILFITLDAVAGKLYVKDELSIGQFQASELCFDDEDGSLMVSLRAPENAGPTSLPPVVIAISPQGTVITASSGKRLNAVLEAEAASETLFFQPEARGYIVEITSFAKREKNRRHPSEREGESKYFENKKERIRKKVNKTVGSCEAKSVP